MMAPFETMSVDGCSQNMIPLGKDFLGYVWNSANAFVRLRRKYIRRVLETCVDNGATWTAIESRTFVYDDWNLIYERSERPSEGSAELAFFWGPDLSGSLQGAGGVGGLVAVSIDGFFYFPGYDNNGNVIGYWDESGSLVAEYSYDAFGNTLSSSGSMASVFPHRFSTKYYDAETDLYYYGYRYYAPSLGRWISRDPIEETGGRNLYAICLNGLPFDTDPTGLSGILFLRGGDAENAVVSSVEDIPWKPCATMKSFGKFYYHKPNAPFHREIEIELGADNRICEIRFRLLILIQQSLVDKTEHTKNEIYRYKKHYVLNLKQNSGQEALRGKQYGGRSDNPIFPSTLAHERGHARAFLEILKPRLETELALFLRPTSTQYDSKEVAEREVAAKVDKLFNEPSHLEKSSQYANDGTIGFYEGNPLYKSLGPTTIYGRMDGDVPIDPPQKYDHQWERK